MAGMSVASWTDGPCECGRCRVQGLFADRVYRAMEDGTREIAVPIAEAVVVLDRIQQLEDEAEHAADVLREVLADEERDMSRLSPGDSGHPAPCGHDAEDDPCEAPR